MLKLKLQYFGHLMQRADSLEKTLIPGKVEGKRSRGQQRIRWLISISDSMDMNLSKLQEDRGARSTVVHGSQRVRQGLMTEQVAFCSLLCWIFLCIGFFQFSNGFSNIHFTKNKENIHLSFSISAMMLTLLDFLFNKYRITVYNSKRNLRSNLILPNFYKISER